MFFDARKDYFSILGIVQTTDPSQIKLAYRKQAKRYHPDRCRLPNAKERFQEIREAYEVLTESLDDYIHAYQSFNGFSSQSTSGFSQRQSQQNYQYHRSHNTQRNSHRRNKKPPKSSGFEQHFYQHHHGSGSPIRGKDKRLTFPVTLRYALTLLKQGSFKLPLAKKEIPFNRQALLGQEFYFAEQGYPGLYGGASGDLYIRFQLLEKDDRYWLDDENVYMVVNVYTWTQGLKQIIVDSAFGLLRVKLPANWQSLRYLRLKGKGLPRDGLLPPTDLYLKLNPVVEDSPSSSAASEPSEKNGSTPHSHSGEASDQGASHLPSTFTQ